MHHGEAQDCVELLRVLAVYHPPLGTATVGWDASEARLSGQGAGWAAQVRNDQGDEIMLLDLGAVVSYITDVLEGRDPWAATADEQGADEPDEDAGAGEDEDDPDEVDERTVRYQEQAESIAAAIDPAIDVASGDGEVFEGPVVMLAYLHDTDLPVAEQERRLGPVAEQLHAAGLPVVFLRPSAGARLPFIEIACDIAHHRRMMATLAAMDRARRAEAMRSLGVLPTAGPLTSDASGWAGEEE
jgi:hypothetical protein